MRKKWRFPFRTWRKSLLRSPAGRFSSSSLLLLLLLHPPPLWLQQELRVLISCSGGAQRCRTESYISFSIFSPPSLERSMWLQSLWKGEDKDEVFSFFAALCATFPPTLRVKEPWRCAVGPRRWLVRLACCVLLLVVPAAPQWPGKTALQRKEKKSIIIIHYKFMLCGWKILPQETPLIMPPVNSSNYAQPLIHKSGLRRHLRVFFSQKKKIKNCIKKCRKVPTSKISVTQHVICCTFWNHFQIFPPDFSAWHPPHWAS